MEYGKMRLIEDEFDFSLLNKIISIVKKLTIERK